MEKILYRGYTIKAEAYTDKETGKWVPRAFILHKDEVPNDEIPLTWQREFETQIEAEDFAADGAKFYIDNNF